MAVPDTVSQSSHRRRAVLASTVGTTIEWYDFFLYNTAASLIFPALFFPKQAAFTGILLSFGTQFVGFAARPVGAAIFGHYGDRIGRKATLIATLLLMGISTTLIGVLPTYAAIGYAAPILLTLLRIGQGVGVGGEWGGSVLLSMEWGKRTRRGLMASWPQLGVPLGLVLSTGIFRLMTDWTGPHFESWGWRIPFLLSIVLVAVGLYVRLRVLESPEFTHVVQTDSVVRRPLLEVVRTEWRTIITSAFVRLGEQAPFYLFTSFVLTYGTKQLGLDRDGLLDDILIAATIGLITVPVFGHLSDRFGRRRVYGTGIVLTAIFAFPYFGLLNTKESALILVAIVLSLVFHDMQYGPQAALIAESFGTNLRYSGAGLGYQLASVIAGGPAPLIATKILQSTGSSTGISWYVIGCCALGFGALLLLPRRSHEPAPAKAASVRS
ncbi:MHS family MFS transporter [Actinoplanes sp. TBRC 11911]|uniref:MFS transporter n=1 Tax=Actinoplanes sp. TBRC 11911 TaxID=2729386 RepID=UPI00145FCBBA|nr:MFS transporter [Actinoplanes sp. TBRC 11911]NMO56961.1 MHS family MFS transporter [Actinoplanes sp. TBRC 11911]